MLQAESSFTCQADPSDRYVCPFFEISNDVFYELGGKVYCLFHAPLDASASGEPGILKEHYDPTMFSDLVRSYILKKADEGEKYRPTYAKSNTSLWTTQVLRTLSDTLGSRIGFTDLRKVVFPGYFSTKGMRIIDADFSNAVFNGEVEFDKSSFEFLANFYNAVFKQTVWFNDCSFKGNAIFCGCAFQSNAYFVDAKFHYMLDLSGSTFGQMHICSSSGDACSASEPGLANASIRNLNLRNCCVKGMLCLRHRTIDRLDLKKSVFECAPIFSTTELGQDVLFRTATFKDTRPSSLSSYLVLQRAATEVGDFSGADMFRGLAFACQSTDPETPRILAVAD